MKALARRVDRLEQRHLLEDAGGSPKVIVLWPGGAVITDAQILGYSSGDETFLREPGETLDALARRIASGLHRPELFTLVIAGAD